MRTPWLLWILLLMVVFPVAGQDNVATAVLSAINQARAEQGAPALVFNAQLQQAAQRHSDDMAARDVLSHTGSDGSRFWDRIQQAGYNMLVGAENVLSRPDTDVQGVFSQWNNSPPHQANMLNASYLEAGIAYAQAASGTYYFTLVLAVQPDFVPSTSTPQPTATATPRATDVVVSTIIAPLPTNTTAPVQATTLAPVTPIPVASITPTPTESRPPDVRLLYDTQSFALLNISGEVLNLANVTFESSSGTMSALRWDTEFLSQPLSGFTDQDCLQVWPVGITQRPKPEGCRYRHAWVMISEEEVFWLGTDAFFVLNRGERVGVCEVTAGVCEVNLSTVIPDDVLPTAVPTLPMPDQPDIRLEYDSQSFALINISDRFLDLRGLLFRGEAGAVEIERWETEFLTEPLGNFSANDCLQAWEPGITDLPRPERCEFRHAWIVLSGDALFWQSGSSFTVERDGTILARCSVPAGECELSLEGDLGVSQEVNSTATPMVADIMGTAEMRLHISSESVTLQNTSSGTLDVSRLTFESDAGTFFSSRWRVEALSQPLEALPRGDCVQVWQAGTALQAAPAACSFRHAWVAVAPSEVFWQDVTVFRVWQEGQLLATCETRSPFCDVDLP